MAATYGLFNLKYFFVVYRGSLYINGQGVLLDYEQAVYWYRKAAEQGDMQSQSNLGVAYVRGLGVPKDYIQAVEWYRKSAEQGYAEAQYNLGFMYGSGRGVQQSYKMAYILFSLAAANNHAEALKNLGMPLTELSSPTIADAERIIRDLRHSKDFAAELRELLNSQN
ncbi:MAG: sel1 repeat family protein [Moraxellaceae bacterium]|nr:sel1 repeat family protein [Moraxellaceae bacterium]